MAINPKTPEAAIKLVQTLMAKLLKRGVSAKKVTKLVGLVGKKTGTSVQAKKILDDLVVTASQKGKAATKASGLYNRSTGAELAAKEMRPHTAFFFDAFKKGYSIKKFPEATKALDYITIGGSKQSIREGMEAGFSKMDMRTMVQGLLFGRGTGRGLN